MRTLEIKTNIKVVKRSEGRGLSFLRRLKGERQCDLEESLGLRVGRG